MSERARQRQNSGNIGGGWTHCWSPMRAKPGHDGEGREILPEVRAGLVLVKPKSSNDARRSREGVNRRGGTWVLPLMRVVVLAALMLFLTPTRGMGVPGMSMMDAWKARPESDPYDEQRTHG